uniref:Ig-like domain-containing protein n=1 Tax=Cyclopterus lumpus TaxID=8103 RepID=A0A8C2ZVC6_CYCLU
MSQFFEYEKISLSCGRMSSGDWTVWRYTAESMKLSHCGSGWGDHSSSTCVMKTAKLSDSGVYWCQSQRGESSNSVNVLVVGGPVILQSPVLPVTEGHDVTLSCRTKTTSDLPADFYKDGSLIGRAPTGHMTLQRFSKSDEAVYKCNIGADDSPPSRLLTKDGSDVASLTASPDSSQLFEYENLSLSCGGGWSVRRFTASDGKMSGCGGDWGSLTSGGCVLHTVKLPDGATYWCQSAAQQRSNSVQITVYDKPVLLRTPVLPVMEGHDVTLSCRTKTTSDLPADFYKDGSFMRTEPTGHMTLQHVARSDEGLYRCNMSGAESPPSWLAVTGEEDSALSVLGVMRHLLVFSPYCISTVIIVSLYRHRPSGRKQPVSTTMAPPSEEDEGLDRPYGDVIDDVTTEYHF